MAEKQNTCAVSFTAYNNTTVRGVFNGVDPETKQGMIKTGKHSAWLVKETDDGLRAYNADFRDNPEEWFPVIIE